MSPLVKGERGLNKTTYIKISGVDCHRNEEQPKQHEYTETESDSDIILPK